MVERQYKTYKDSKRVVRKFGNYSIVDNHTSDVVPYVTQASYFVQDYNSEVMRSMRRQSWFLRCYIHKVCNPSSKVYMATLTYNDTCVPSFDTVKVAFCHGHINPNKKDYIPTYIPCFSKNDVQNFMKKLRKRLPNNKIKYLICSEYGENYTKRSHYHALFFVDGPHTFEEFEAACRSSWTITKGHGVTTSYYPLGNIYFSKSPLTGSYECNDSNALRYVTKYITKDLYYLGHPHYKKLDDAGRMLFHRYEPFHLQSTNFGCDWYKHMDVWDTLINGVKVQSYTKSGLETKRYSLPSYCIDRLFCRHIYLSTPAPSELEGVRRVHRKEVKHKQLVSFVRYQQTILRARAHDLALKHSWLDEDNCYALLLWSKIRGSLLPNAMYRGTICPIFDCARDLMEGVQPTVHDMQFAYKFILYRSDRDKSHYVVDFDGPKFFQDHGYKPLFATPYGAILDKQLSQMYKKLSDSSESIMQAIADKAERIKFARESTANHPVQ